MMLSQSNSHTVLVAPEFTWAPHIAGAFSAGSAFFHHTPLATDQEAYAEGQRRFTLTLERWAFLDGFAQASEEGV
jgi:hypothetical protein